jgi:hypothetical protein
MPFVTTEQFNALVTRVARAELLSVTDTEAAARIVKIFGPIAAYNSAFGFSQDGLPGDDEIVNFFTRSVLVNNVTEKYIYENKDTLLDDLLSLKKYDEVKGKQIPLFDSIADISGGELGSPDTWINRPVYSFDVHGEKKTPSNRCKYNLTVTISSDAGVLKAQKVIYDSLAPSNERTVSETRKSKQLSELKALLKFSGDYSSICVPTSQYADEEEVEDYWISVDDVVVAISNSRGKETLEEFGATLTFPRCFEEKAEAKANLIAHLLAVEWKANGYHVCVPAGADEPTDRTIGLEVVVGLGFVTQEELVSYLLTSESGTLAADLATVGFGDLSLSDRIAIISAIDEDDADVEDKIDLVLSTLSATDKAIDVLEALLEAFTLGEDGAPDLLTLKNDYRRKLTPDQVAIFSMITVINDSENCEFDYDSFSEDVDYSLAFHVKRNGDIVEVFESGDYTTANFLTLNKDEDADVTDKTVIKVLNRLGLYTVAYVSAQLADKTVPEAFKQLKDLFGLADVLANEIFRVEEGKNVTTASALVQYLEEGDNTIITEINSVTEWLKTETGIAQMHDVADERVASDDAESFATAAALLIADGVDAELVWEALQSADAEKNPDQAIDNFLDALIGGAGVESKLLYGLLRAIGVAGCLAGFESSRQFTEDGDLTDNWVLAFTDKVYWEELKSAGFAYAELLTYFEIVKIVQFKNGVGFSAISETKVFAFDLIELGAFYGLSNDEITSIARQLGYVIELD